MLRSIEISGFKAIKNAYIELTPVTVIIGRNGSGKSSAIEALQWLQEAIELGIRRATEGRFRRFDDLLNRRTERMSLDLWFDSSSKKREPVHYTVSVKSGSDQKRAVVESEKCHVGRTRASTAILFSRRGSSGPPLRVLQSKRGRNLLVRSGDELGLSQASVINAPGVSELESFLRRAVFLRLSPVHMALASVYSPHWSATLAEDGSDIASLLARLPEAARKRIARRITNIFPDVRSLGTRGKSDNEYFFVREHMIARGGAKTFEIPSWLLSEGIRRIVAIFALLEVEPLPSLIVVEEVENGLDPWTLREVFDALRDAASNGVQVIVTTHSPYLLNFVEAGSVVHVARNKGNSEYKRLAEFPIFAEFESLVQPGSMYVSSMFGDFSNGEDQ